MNGYECGTCGMEPCTCEETERREEHERKIIEGKAVAEIGIDVFSKVRWWRIKIIRWFWPDLQRLSDALDDYRDKS